jgi:signal transduction histidine kinase
VHALSEIEVWSRGVNLARGREVTLHDGGQEQRVESLTDGDGPDGKILPLGEWLERHREHGRLRLEFERLIPLHRAMINRAEVHALWTCSVLLGLAAATPLLIAHHRRMIPKEEIKRMRKRIASDLHDDVGSNLGSISLIARVAKNHLNKSDTDSAVRRDLDELESIARESSLAMRDIVWLVEQDRNSVGDLIVKLRDLCNRLLRGIDVSFDCAECGAASKLSPDAKRDLFLFCKEAFHNILKHARATKVHIRLWDEGDQLALEISDNGVGMPLKEHDDTGRISKLTARAEALKAHMRIKSSRENGTRIRLHIRRNPIIPRILKLNLIFS